MECFHYNTLRYAILTACLRDMHFRIDINNTHLFNQFTSSWITMFCICLVNQTGLFASTISSKLDPGVMAILRIASTDCLYRNRGEFFSPH